MPEPYDDDEYMRLVLLLQETVHRILNMEGNTPELIRDEVENAISNYE